MVLPTPPFWLAQAIVWPTQCPARNALTIVDSTIAGRFDLGRRRDRVYRRRHASRTCASRRLRYRWFHVNRARLACRPRLAGVSRETSPSAPASSHVNGVGRPHGRSAPVGPGPIGRPFRCRDRRPWDTPPRRRRRSTVTRGTVRAGATLAIRRGSTRHDLAPRRGRRDGDGLAGTDRRPVPAGRSAQPHLVLVFGIVVTVAVGLEAGLVWAFVGGLVLDVLAQRRSVPRPSPCCSAWAARRPARRLSSASARRPDRRHLLLSLVYSMILFVAFNALAAADPGRATRSRSCCPAPSMTPCSPRSSARWRSRSTTDGPTRSGWTGERLPRRAPEAGPSLSRFLVVRAVVDPRRRRADGAAVLPPDRERRPVRDAADARTARSSRRSRRRAA